MESLPKVPDRECPDHQQDDQCLARQRINTCSVNRVEVSDEQKFQASSAEKHLTHGHFNRSSKQAKIAGTHKLVINKIHNLLKVSCLTFTKIAISSIFTKAKLIFL